MSSSGPNTTGQGCAVTVVPLLSTVATGWSWSVGTAGAVSISASVSVSTTWPPFAVVTPTNVQSVVLVPPKR